MKKEGILSILICHRAAIYRPSTFYIGHWAFYGSLFNLRSQRPKRAQRIKPTQPTNQSNYVYAFILETHQ